MYDLAYAVERKPDKDAKVALTNSTVTELPPEIPLTTVGRACTVTDPVHAESRRVHVTTQGFAVT